REDFYAQALPLPEDVLLVVEVAETSLEYDRDEKIPRYAQTRLVPQPFRVVLVAPGKTRQDGLPDVWVLGTPRLDLAAAWLALAYRYRWAVELFQSQDIKFTWGPFFFWSVTTGGSSKGNT